MITKSFKRLVALFATLTCLAGMAAFIPKFSESAEAKISTEGSHLTPEEVGEPIVLTDPSGRVTFTIQQITDGIDAEKCVVTEENGFDLVDTGGQDGVVCVGDVIRYRISYNVAASDTETSLKLRLNSIIENRDGVKISERETFVSDGILEFASGGQGFLHTGTVEGSSANPILSMTFPASQETSSIVGTVLELQTNSIHTDQVANLEASFTSPIATGTTKFENPIIVVGTTLWDPKLYNATPSPTFVVENGESFYEYEFTLHIPSNSREVNVTNKDLIGYASSAFVAQDAQVTMDFSNFPEDSIIESMNTNVTVIGSYAIYENGEVLYNSSIRSNSTKGDEVVRVKIPVSALENNQAYEWNANITGYTSRAYNTLTNASTFLKPYGFMGQGNNVEPGLGESSEYDTSSFYKNVELTKTGTDYLNNNWAKATLETNNTGEGQRYKDMWADDEGSVSTTNINRLGGASQAVFIGDKYWSELGSKPYSGTLKNASYCDAWNEKLQRIDTSRNIISQVRDEDNGWTDVPYTVMYGDASAAYIDNSSSLYTGATIGSRCEAASTVWTTTPTSDTNLVKIVLEGTYSASVSGTENVQRVYVPMETTEEENYSQSNRYTSDKIIYNNFVLKNDDTRYDENAPRASVSVRYETLNPITAALTNSTQNAGTTLPITNIGKVSSTNRMKDFEDFETTPVVEYRFDSAYSNITLANSVYENYNVTITRPDHGPDGLAGTEDDVDGSYWVFRLEAKNPVLMTSTANTVDLVNLGNNAFTGTLPGHIPAGTELVKKLDYYPDENIQQYRDLETDNYKEGKITVAATAAVFQGKWALKDVEYAGNQIGWGIMYGSTLGSETYNGFFYDILPYNGDSRGTVLAEPLSDIDFNIRQGDSDMTIEVTDDDPSTITRESINNGTTEFVPLSEADTLAGEVTAFVMREETIEPSAIRHIEVTASTAGSAADNIVYNNMEQASAEGYANSIPATPAVSTRLVSGTISGTVYFDDDQNGSIGENETRRFENTVIQLIDEDNNEIATTTSDADGNYNFENVPEGNYKVVVKERGENLGESFAETGETEYDISITMNTPTHNDLNFGYWLDAQPSVTVDKRIDGYVDGADIVGGTVVTFEAVVTNTGNVPLNGVAVDDNVLGSFVCPQDTLQVEESMICTITTEYRTTE